MPAAGPLGQLIHASSARDLAAVNDPPDREFSFDANALILMRRVAFLKDSDDGPVKLDDDGQRALLRWAAGHALGQDPELARQVVARRALAVRQLRARGVHVVRLSASPEWRLAVGLGEKANPHEIGLSLHGTYGWPVIPGSSLKGLTAAWASDPSVADPQDVRRVLGTPRLRPAKSPAAPAKQAKPGKADARGTVCFLDAIPARPGPVRVSIDVLTPHVKRYYETASGKTQDPAEPPAEYHNPVPVNFLTVSGPFIVDLYGRNARDVDLARDWLIKAGDELGAGAKTAAGYGYLSITELDEDE